jgi:hypothetical protein
MRIIPNRYEALKLANPTKKAAMAPEMERDDFFTPLVEIIKKLQ